MECKLNSTIHSFQDDMSLNKIDNIDSLSEGKFNLFDRETNIRSL